MTGPKYQHVKPDPRSFDNHPNGVLHEQEAGNLHLAHISLTLVGSKGNVLMTIRLDGNWKKGFAYDVHTLDSVYLGADELGYDRWKNTRSEMGELVYRLKYQADFEALAKIVDLVGIFKGIETMDYIVPIPATNPQRRFQPVTAIAHELGKRTGVRVVPNLLEKRRGGRQLKNVDDPQERHRLLVESMRLAEDLDVSNKNILLVDDLYRSGATLTVATELLYDKGHVKDVYVLTMTKTRSSK